MLHALAAAAWLPAAPGRQLMWCGARQLRSGSSAWLPLRPRLCSSPQMQAGGAREAHTGSAASSVDALVDELSEVVATHARSPLPLGELHRSLQTLTAKAAATLESAAAEPGAAPPPSPPPPPVSVSAKLTVAELKAALKARDLPTSGLKAELLARLAAAAPTPSPQLAGDVSSAASASEGGRDRDGDRDRDRGPLLSRSEAEDLSSEDPALASVLRSLARTYRGQGPQTGIFTDGSCSPNPGPGGWGVVAVRDGEVLWSNKRHVREETTNNRMEMSAIIHALREVGDDGGPHVIYSDSQLCVKTLNEWAHGWSANGWTKKSSGEIKNLDLVREAYTLAQQRPLVRFEWIKAHAGWHWNEHADRLASAWMRGGAGR